MKKEGKRAFFKRGSMIFDKKFELTVITFVMALIMSGVISLMVSLVKYELDVYMLIHWLESWILAFIIAFPTARLVLPLVRKYAWLLVKS